MIHMYFYYSCILLLPNVNNPNKINEFRPISLSNFTGKIISKLMSNRISPILCNLISLNQYCFDKGISMSENIMLAQYIIHQIKKPYFRSNFIINFVMIKAYDRVSWSYMCLVLWKMGFHELFIDIVLRVMAKILYSIIMNSKRYVFFNSNRGIKQGDPFFPAQIILGVQVLLKTINRLHKYPDYHRFFMEVRGTQVNHFTFVDDNILFIL